MADYYVKLIPCMHTYRTNEKNAAAAVEMLKTMVEADEITFRQSDEVQFVDCGDMLESITCPRCGAPVALDWWKEKMEEMRQRDHFFILEQEMPCCGREVSFNQLRYEAPCGFSSLEFTIRNPKTPVNGEVIDRLSQQFGLLLRKVEAHF